MISSHRVGKGSTQPIGYGYCLKPPRLSVTIYQASATMIFYRMHRVRTTTGPYGIGDEGRSPAPGSETNTTDWFQIRNTIMNYSIPIQTGGERCLIHIIHQFLTHAHWIILSILLLLSTIMFNNIFFLFYISYCRDPMYAPLHPVYISVFSHSPTYSDS